MRGLRKWRLRYRRPTGPLNRLAAYILLLVIFILFLFILKYFNPETFRLDP